MKRALSQRTKYLLTIAIASTPSLAGIAYGAYANPTDGARGGAITVALSFLILFLRKNHGHSTQETLNAINLPNETPMDKIERKIDAISARLNVNDDGQGNQNKALAWISCIGTFTWGFGDLISGWLKKFLI